MNISGTDSGDFSTSFSGTITLAQGESTTVDVTFTPGSTGSKSGTLSVTSDAATVLPFSVALTGTKGVSRVTSGLQLIYDFDNYGGGSTINSSGGAAGPFPLTIDNTGRVSASTGNDGIVISNAVRITSSSAPSTLISNLKSADEITIEAWVRPANTSQGGPARIVSLSQNSSNRNFSLMQDGNRYEARLRTSNNNNNGTSPNVRTGRNDASATLQHVVFIINQSNGRGRIYVNGTRQANTRNAGGNFNNWDSGYKLIVGNEFGGNLNDRDWRGTIYTIAIYNRSLSEAEITQNYNAGEE